MWESLEHTGGWRGEIWNKRKDGSIYPELLTISRVSGEHDKSSGFVGVFADITALKQTEAQLTHLAHHDSLTGLPNRLLLNARLDQSILHAERNHNSLAVVFIDLDRFKNINDSLGHPAGDLVLQELANRLTHLTRRDDTIARISGLAVPTVSRALNDAPDIGQATKVLVRKIASEIGYVPNRAGVRLRTGRTNVISLVMPTEHDIMNHTARLISSVAGGLRNTPFHLIVTPFFPDQDPMDPVRYIVETGSADAVIFNQVRPQDPRVAYLMEKGFPFATHGRSGISHLVMGSVAEGVVRHAHCAVLTVRG